MSAILFRRAPRAAVLAAGAALLCIPAWAATPSSGTASQSSSQANWTGGPKTPTAAATCGSATNASCDNYKLTIVSPSEAYKVEITAVDYSGAANHTLVGSAPCGGN